MATQPFPLDFPADIDRTAASIVVDQASGHPLGTGFYFLRPKYFVTAKHVVMDRTTGCVRDQLVLMQRGPDYPRVVECFVHPTLDLAVLEIDRPVCEIPLYPSHQRLAGHRGLRYWGYAPTRSNTETQEYQVLVVDVPSYSLEPLRERDDGCEQVLRFDTDFAETGHSGGPVLAVGGGVCAVIIEGHSGWARATEIQPLMSFVELRLESG